VRRIKKLENRKVRKDSAKNAKGIGYGISETALEYIPPRLRILRGISAEVRRAGIQDEVSAVAEFLPYQARW
jgi:hypothetical protein